MARPPMKQVQHPAHNVPPPVEEHNGDVMPASPMGQDTQMINQILANYGRPMGNGHDNDDY